MGWRELTVLAARLSLDASADVPSTTNMTPVITNGK
jgi:hypothetical protein